MLEKIKNIKAFVFDVDGVLTDSSLLCTEDGQLLRTMNARDGYAMVHAVKMGFKLCIITGGASKGVFTRLQNLGIVKIYDKSTDKVANISEYVLEENLSFDNILYMGDDIPDMDAMQLCGLKVCPNDAVEEILALADIKTVKNGGHGCVREIIEHVMKTQNKW